MPPRFSATRCHLYKIRLRTYDLHFLKPLHHSSHKYQALEKIGILISKKWNNKGQITMQVGGTYNAGGAVFNFIVVESLEMFFSCIYIYRDASLQCVPNCSNNVTVWKKKTQGIISYDMIQCAGWCQYYFHIQLTSK